MSAHPGGLISDGLARARMLVEARRYRDALETLAPVLASDPESSETFALIAMAHHGLNQHDAMLVAARRAVALQPHDSTGHRLVSVALCSVGRRWDGLDAAREACRLDPHSWHAQAQCAVALADAARRRARWHQTLDLTRRRPLREACRLAAAALAAAPDRAEAQFAMGYTLRAAGRTRRAAAAYRAALAIDPGHAPAHNNLALIDIRHHALVSAARHLRTSLRLEPDGPEARQNLEVLVRRTLVIGWIFLAAVDVAAVFAGLAAGWPARAALAAAGLCGAALVASRLVQLVTPPLLGWVATTLRRRIRPWVDGTLLVLAAGNAIALVVLSPSAVAALGAGYADGLWLLARVALPIRLLLMLTRPWDRGDPR